MNQKEKFRTAVWMAAAGTVLFLSQILLAALPNVELVSLLVMELAVVFGLPGLMAVAVFVLLEILVYGFSVWNIFYLYVWTILFLLAWLMRRTKSKWPFVLLSAAFGFSFGFLCSLFYGLTAGWTTLVAWWLAGIGYDILHGIANGILAALLFAPVRKLLEKEKGRLKTGRG